MFTFFLCLILGTTTGLLYLYLTQIYSFRTTPQSDHGGFIDATSMRSIGY